MWQLNIAQSLEPRKYLTTFIFYVRSTFEPCESLCMVGSFHFVPANDKVNLMEENGTHLDKSSNCKSLCCTFVSGSCKMVGLFNVNACKINNW